MSATYEKNTELEEMIVFERFFKGFDTRNVDLNPVAFICHLKPVKSKEGINFLKQSLRESFLEVLDALSKVGLSMPIFVIMECEIAKVQYENSDENRIQDYDTWNEIAGDQDWHRGNFLIITCDPSDKKNNAEKIFKDLKHPIFSQELTYKYTRLSNIEFASYFEEHLKQVPSELKSLEEELKAMLFKRFASKIKESSKTMLTEAINEALNSWKRDVIKTIEMNKIDRFQERV